MKYCNSLYLKVQEHMGCFSTTVPLSEMSKIHSETSDLEETAAVKWIALTIIQDVNLNAEKIVLSRDNEDNFCLTAEYPKSGLSSFIPEQKSKKKSWKPSGSPPCKKKEARTSAFLGDGERQSDPAGENENGKGKDKNILKFQKSGEQIY